MDRRDNFKGALLMMVSMFSFTLNDTFIKLLAGQVPLNQVLFLRGGVLTTVLIYVMIRLMGPMRWRIPRRDAWLVALRVLAEAASAYFFLTALFNMPLANVTAILQSLPLTITLAAAVFLREPVGWRRLGGRSSWGVRRCHADRAAGGVGFYDLFGLRACCRGIRHCPRFGNAASVARDTVDVGHAAVVSRGDGVFRGLKPERRMGGTGNPPDVLCPRRIGDGHRRVCLFDHGDAGGEISFVAPFRYTGLIWALLLGYFVFGDWPGMLTLVGGRDCGEHGDLYALQGRTGQAQSAVAARRLSDVTPGVLSSSGPMLRQDEIAAPACVDKVCDSPYTRPIR